MLSVCDTAIAAQKLSLNLNCAAPQCHWSYRTVCCSYMTKWRTSERDRLSGWWQHYPENLNWIPTVKPHACCVCAACSGTPCSTVQSAKFNGSSNVQIMKQAGSVSCLECLPLLTAITFINIMVFDLGLGLCLSNSHTVFLLIPHFKFLNITIDCYIVYPSDSSSKLFNKCFTIPPLPSLPTLYPITLTQSALNTQSPLRNVLLLFLLFQTLTPALSSLTQSPFSPRTTTCSTHIQIFSPPLSSLTQSPFSPLNYQLFHSHPNILPSTQFPNTITILTTELSTVPLTSKYSPQHSVP